MSIGAIHAQCDGTVARGTAIPLSLAAQDTLDKWLAMIAEDDFSGSSGGQSNERDQKGEQG